MSGYLNRLVKRTQVANKSQELRPFVRSTSPIAEHDQRLSVAGLEDAKKGGSPSADVDTDLGLGQAGEDQALMVPDITALSDTTVQRKIAGSDTPAPSTASSPSPASVLGSSDMPSPTVRADRSGPMRFVGGVPPNLLTPLGRESGASVQGDRSAGSTALLSSPITGKSGSQPPSNQRDRPIDSAEQQSPLRPPLTASKVPAIVIETNRMAGADPVLGVPPLDMPSLNRPSVEEGEEIAKLNDLRSQSTLKPSQSTVPSLEPSTHGLSDRDELWVEGGTTSDRDKNESPRVTIGRITVEVISQTAIAATAAPSRLGSLTAASVSVIGPLGSGVSSHLRLSLRQR